MRKRILFPVIALAAGLFLSVSAQAQPPRPPGPGGPGGFRPGMPPPPPVQVRPGIGIGIRPAPGLGINIGIGGPSFPPPLYPPPFYPPPRPPIVIVDPICNDYRVVYRDCSHDPWRTYRVYESHRLAHVVADQLRDRGYEARVLHD